MNAPKTNRHWLNRHVGFELAALSIALLAMLTHSTLERVQALRLGNHIDAVTICVAVAIILGLVGLLLPPRSGESKRLAFVVFVLMILVFIFPALLPAK